jgi:hypothetical protein
MDVHHRLAGIRPGVDADVVASWLKRAINPVSRRTENRFKDLK